MDVQIKPAISKMALLGKHVLQTAYWLCRSLQETHHAAHAKLPNFTDDDEVPTAGDLKAIDCTSQIWDLLGPQISAIPMLHNPRHHESKPQDILQR